MEQRGGGPASIVTSVKIKNLDIFTIKTLESISNISGCGHLNLASCHNLHFVSGSARQPDARLGALCVEWRVEAQIALSGGCIALLSHFTRGRRRGGDTAVLQDDDSDAVGTMQWSGLNVLVYELQTMKYWEYKHKKQQRLWIKTNPNLITVLEEPVCPITRDTV